MPAAFKARSATPFLFLSLVVCGCATEPDVGQSLCIVAPAPATPVRYTDVRPEDLVPDGDYHVRRGDVLEMSITDLVAPGLETVKVLRVTESGMISLPLLGDVRVLGLTEAEINRRIDDEYRKSSINF